jgi:hypothetical protein
MLLAITERSGPEDSVATINKTPSNTWKALIRMRGWPTTIKTFRTKRDAQDWAMQVSGVSRTRKL